jgi:hypothetical protein
MPGYIEQFKKLSKREQKQELENKVRSTQDAISRTPAFARLVKLLVNVGRVTNSEPSEWDIEDSRISEIEFDEDKQEIRCAVRYNAVLNSLFHTEDVGSKGRFSGSITAVIDNAGRVRYENTPLGTSQSARAPKRPLEQFPFGSEKWIEQHANLERWLDAEESTAKYQNFRKRYHVQININKYSSRWEYNIMPYGNLDEVLDHKSGYRTIEEVIDAALRSLVTIWKR